MKSFYEIKKSSDLFASERELTRFLKRLLVGKAKIFEIRNRQGELVPYHAHQNTEILFVLEGRLRAIIEEDIVDLGPGDIAIIEPFSIHLVAFPFSEGARFYLCSCSNPDLFSTAEETAE